MSCNDGTEPAGNDIEGMLRAGDSVILSGIDWDTESDDDGQDGEPDLPETVTLTLPAGWEPGDGFADLLSDAHGFCVNGIGRVDRAG